MTDANAGGSTHVLSITLLGTGSPLPDPDRAGPATLVSTSADEHFLVDAGRGCLMRLASTGVGVDRIAAVLLTHLHSDHFTDLNDVITTRWVMTFQPSPLTIVGPPGTQEVVDGIVASLGNDIQYRVDHHDDLRAYGFTPVDVIEVADGPVDIGSSATITTAPTDHRPVHPTIGFRIDHEGASVVAAGDTVRCEGLDRLSEGADVLVHTVIRKDLLENVPMQRLQDTLDYHSSPAEAAQTAARAGVETLVLTHYVPAFPPGDAAAAEEWRALAANHFTGTVEVGDDLHRIDING